MTREQPPPVPVESNCTLVLFNEEGIEGGGGGFIVATVGHLNSNILHIGHPLFRELVPLQ